MRILLFFALLAFALAGFGRPEATAGTSAAPLSLRASISVEDAVIRLGDLFDGELSDPTVAVARAPAPGDSVVLNAPWLLALARAYDLSWRPDSRFEQTVVARASQVVGAAEIRAAVIRAVAERGMTGELDVQFDSGIVALHLPVGVTRSVTVQQLNFDPRSGRFAATVAAPAEGPAAVRGAISGRVFAMIDLPVAARRLVPGEVIRLADIDWVSIRADRVASNVVVDPAQLVGKSPRRPIRAGEPVRTADLQTAVTIKKGSIVTMQLQSPQMTLTVQVRTLADGIEGDVVRVMNTKSNRIIAAVVLDASTVAVVADGAGQ